MSKIEYIDPLFEEAAKSISPAVQREVERTFDIALRIHEILLRKQWTQADLAKATHKTEALVSTWLSGSHNFTIRTIAEIESALGEDIISVKRYRKNAEIVSGYKISPRKAAFLNEAKVRYGKK